MTVYAPWIPSAGTIVEMSVPLPRTAEEARAFVRARNAEAKRERERKDAAHTQRQAATAEATRQAETAPATTGRLNAVDYYRTSWARAVKKVQGPKGAAR